MFALGAVAFLTARNNPQAGVVDQRHMPFDHVLAVRTQHLHFFFVGIVAIGGSDIAVPAALVVPGDHAQVHPAQPQLVAQ